MNISRIYEIYLQYPSVKTDTRNIGEGDIFFALRGPHFNGNSFAGEALQKGAAFCVVDDEVAGESDRFIRVHDSLQTLQELASFHRDKLNIPVIAITGSNGKTTTKELLHAVLSTTFTTYTTEGNLNNHIGVPLTILKIEKDAQMAVVEMGANHLHEIESYCRYARPDFGLITNIGKAHLEGFGSEEGVKKGKGELFDYLKTSGGTAFVNADDKNVVDLARPLTKKVLYGSHLENFSATVLYADPFLSIRVQVAGKEFTLSTHLVGSYNLPNILAAIAVGSYFKIGHAEMRSAIEAYHPANSRSQLITQGSNTIILDAYNANPGSMKAAIENFAGMNAASKVLILGDMKELGSNTEKEHRDLIRLIDGHQWTAVALAGPVFSSLGHSYYSFADAASARSWFSKSDFQNAFILVKGSRSMQMEQVVL